MTVRYFVQYNEANDQKQINILFVHLNRAPTHLQQRQADITETNHADRSRAGLDLLFELGGG